MNLSRIVKLPIAVVNTKQADMGMDNPEEGGMIAYFDVDEIEMIRQAHDDKLGDTPINTEATMIHMRSGECFFIPLYIDHVMTILKEVQNHINK